MKIADRVENIAESKSIKVAALVAKLRAEGRDLISLGVGEPDFPTPEKIIEEAYLSMKRGETRYSLVPGIPEIRSSIANDWNKNNTFQIESQNILIGHGSKHILYSIFQSICNPTDEVIVNIPYWVSFPESIKLAGAIPITVAPDQNLHLNFDAINSAISSKTRAIIINSPNNPSGVVYTSEELEKLVKICIEKRIYLISDEAYCDLTYSDNNFISPLNIPGAEEFVLVSRSFSKSYSMTGFRLGHLIANESLIGAVNKLQSHLCGNVATFIQRAGVYAINHCEDFLPEFKKIFETRRNLMFDLFSPFFDCARPEGAFYFFPSIEKYLNKEIKSSEEFCEQLLLKKGLAILPGEAFGMDKYIRLAFATNEEDIKKSAKLMGEFLEEIS